MTLNVLIVDDEPIARDILRTYISQIPYLHLTGECGDAFEAMQQINNQSIDLVILDIHMPRLGGLDMLRTLKRYPAIIITSAYPEYALEGFELSVTDYLLKPFSFPRFVQAAAKVLQHSRSTEQPHTGAEKEDFLMVRSDKKLAKVLFKDITYVEAYGNYIYIHCGPARIMSKQPLTQFEEQLPAGSFVRVHKSFIVSMKAIKYVEGNELSIGDKKLPIGKVYKNELLKRFNPSR